MNSFGTTTDKELMAAIGRGKAVLIVCDGFDELSYEQRQEGSVYNYSKIGSCQRLL